MRSPVIMDIHEMSGKTFTQKYPFLHRLMPDFWHDLQTDPEYIVRILMGPNGKIEHIEFGYASDYWLLTVPEKTAQVQA